jgi:hypothetical protein
MGRASMLSITGNSTKREKSNRKGRREPMTDSKSKNPYDAELPQSVIKSFDRFLLPEIRKFYASEEGQKKLLEWGQEHSKDG